MTENEAWTVYRPLFRQPTLIDGRKGAHTMLLMRRRVAGEWQYREASPAEQVDYVSSEAW